MATGDADSGVARPSDPETPDHGRGVAVGIPSDDRIRLILSHPAVTGWVRDDYSIGADPPPAIYIEPVEGVLISFQPMLATLWQAHIAALPEARGRGVEAVGRAAAWLRANTAVERVLAMFPADNPAVLRMVGRAGFEFVGDVPDCFRRGGRLLPLHIYSLRIR